MNLKKKLLEDKLRRVASRRGLRLVKNRRRDILAHDYLTPYTLVNARTGKLVAPRYRGPRSAYHPGFTLHELIDYLYEPRR